MFLELAVPTVILMALAIAVPRLIERAIPETLAGLTAQAAGSSLVLWILAALGFALLYQVENPRVAALLFDDAFGFWHFLILGAKAAVIWAPVLMLVVSTTPRRWKTNTW